MMLRRRPGVEAVQPNKHPRPKMAESKEAPQTWMHLVTSSHMLGVFWKICCPTFGV